MAPEVQRNNNPEAVRGEQPSSGADQPISPAGQQAGRLMISTEGHNSLVAGSRADTNAGSQIVARDFGSPTFTGINETNREAFDKGGSPAAGESRLPKLNGHIESASAHASTKQSGRGLSAELPGRKPNNSVKEINGATRARLGQSEISNSKKESSLHGINDLAHQRRAEQGRRAEIIENRPRQDHSQSKSEPKVEHRLEQKTFEPKVEHRLEQKTFEPKVEHRLEQKTSEPKVEHRLEHKASEPKVEHRLEQKTSEPKVEHRLEQKTSEPKVEHRTGHKESDHSLEYKAESHRGDGNESKDLNKDRSAEQRFQKAVGRADASKGDVEQRDGKVVHKSDVQYRSINSEESNVSKADRSPKTNENSATAKDEKKSLKDNETSTARLANRQVVDDDNEANLANNSSAKNNVGVDKTSEIKSSGETHARHSNESSLDKIAHMIERYDGHHSTNSNAQASGQGMHNNNEQQKNIESVGSMKNNVEDKGTSMQKDDVNRVVDINDRTERNQINLDVQNKGQQAVVGYIPEREQGASKQGQIMQQADINKQGINQNDSNTQKATAQLSVSNIGHSPRGEVTRVGESRSAADSNVGDSSQQNSNQSQITANQSGTNTGTKHGNQDPLSTGGHQGKDPSSQGNHNGSVNHSGHRHNAGSSANHNHHSGTGHDPNQTNDPSGHDPNKHTNDPNNHDPNGIGHDPSKDPNVPGGNDPSNQDPNAKGNHAGQSGNDPNIPHSGSVSSDPNGKQNSDPNSPSDPGITIVNGLPNFGILPNGPNNISYLPEHHNEERPIRFLSDLMAEMGHNLGHIKGPIGNIWAPLDQSPLTAVSQQNNHWTGNNNEISSSQSSSPFSNDNSSVNTNLNSDNIQSLIVGQILPANNQQVNLINSDLSHHVQTGSNNSYVSQLPVIQATAKGDTVNTDPAGTISTITEHNIGNMGPTQISAGDTTAVNQRVHDPFNGQIYQDNSTLISQNPNNISQYWNIDPYNNVPSHMSDPVNHIADPVPIDNSASIGHHDVLPNHDQLVSAAEHNHREHQTDRQHHVNHDSNQRADFNDPWLTNDSGSEHLKPEKELQQRIDQIFSGWQDPVIKNHNKSQSHSAGKAESKPVKNDGLIGQLVTLVNDLNKGKKQNQVQLPKIYIVQKGDTLDSIATKVLGDSKLGLLLYLINQENFVNQGSVDWRNIKLLQGMALYLPSNEEIVTYRSTLPRGASQTNGGGAEWHFDQQYIKGMDDRRRNVERLLGPLSGSLNSKFDRETGRQCVTVRLGDTVRSIALKHSGLNDVSLWKLLAKCNNLTTHVDAKGVPVAILTRGMTLQIPGEEEVAAYRSSQAAIVRAESPRKAISEEVLGKV